MNYSPLTGPAGMIIYGRLHVAKNNKKYTYERLLVTVSRRRCRQN